jgi:hypothetical protein
MVAIKIGEKEHEKVHGRSADTRLASLRGCACTVEVKKKPTTTTGCIVRTCT